MEAIFGWMMSPAGWASFVTLAALEIVLGIDNVIFISIAASRLPKHRQLAARQLGLTLALVFRIALLSVLVWLTGLTATIVSVGPLDFSARDLILIAGGAYLLWKAGQEVGEMLRPASHAAALKGEDATGGPDLFFMVVAQIAVIDVVFAIDSIVTAVGMTNELPIMIAAVVVAIIVMMFASGILSDFIEQNPSTKMLALMFLLLVGLMLVVEGFGVHIPRGYLYAALGFAAVVEVFSVLARRAEIAAAAIEDPAVADVAAPAPQADKAS